MKIISQTRTGHLTQGVLQDETTGKQHIFATFKTKNELSVWLDGCVYTRQIEPKKRASQNNASAQQLQDIIAPMPGRILKVTVEKDVELEAHQVVVVMESMKMELSLTAEVACRVAEVCCKPDDKVDMNQVLVRLLPV